MNPLTGEIREPKYKPGDRVRIRDWDDMAAEYGLDEYESIKIPCSFTDEMRTLCGRELTVKHSAYFTYPNINTYVYKFAENDGGWNWYNIGEEMLEPVVIEPEPEVFGSEEFMTAWDGLL